MVITAAAATFFWGLALPFALTEKVELALITSFFGFLSSTLTVILAYLNRRDIRQHRVEARQAVQGAQRAVQAASKRVDRLEADVRAPRRISTDREEGVRVEAPETQGKDE